MLQLYRIETEALLKETIREDYHYWLLLQADETPLVVCALDQYAGYKNLPTRRSDYLCLGWYQGDCYLVALELRHALVTLARAEDKLAQVEEALKWIDTDLLAEIHQHPPFTGACEAPDEYRLVGAIIPVDYSRRRADQTRRVKLDGRETVIVALPTTLLNAECRLSWTGLLKAIVP